ncbi:MAG TPA: hypothetical protein VGH51_16690 [Candidatus Angelobacter sp.]
MRNGTEIILANLKCSDGWFPQSRANRTNNYSRRSDDVMRECVWLKPEQPAEIEFIERTPRRRLRHASFRRLLPRSGEK